MFALDHPWWLLLLVLIVPSVWVGFRWMSGVPRGRRMIAAGLRCVLIILIVLALSGLQRVRETDRVAVIAVLDVSGSIRSFADFGVDDLGATLSAEQAYRAFLSRAAADQRDEDLLGAVVFDGRATTAALPARTGVIERIEAVQPITGTDLSGAIARARAMLPPDVNGRIVLISDGRSTTGSLDGEAASHAGEIPVDVAPIRYRVDQEVVVESVELPSRALPESVVDVRVVLRSASAVRGAIRLFYDGVPLDLDTDQAGDSMRVQLSEGRQVVTIPVQLNPGRVHRMRAVFEPERGTDSIGRRVNLGDTSEENNSAGGMTITPGHGRVLIVDSESNAEPGGAGELLVSSLERASWAVSTIPASAFPLDLLEIEQYDLIVLVNTPRDGFDEAVEPLLDTYTRVLGGGLVFVGGDHALGAGGWRGSVLEPILPVNLDVADDVVVPEAAVVIVLDSSGSMRRAVFGSSRTQQTVANESAAGAIDALDPHDRVGVISFSSRPRLVVPIGPNSDPETTRKAVLAIRSEGGTFLGPAMEMAREQLDSIEAKSKHVIVLTDGRSENAETLPGIAQGFGQAGIKVSTIAVGDDADEATLRQMATRSGGVAYRVINPSRLPRVFLKAISVVRTPMVREEPFMPIVLDAASPATGDLGVLPTLGGLVMTERRDDPLVSTPIVSDRGEPVLAYHQVELGRVAVFTSDASEWARAWIETSVFDRFWSSLSRWTMRSASDEPGELSMIVRDGRVEIRYEAIDERGEPMDGLTVAAQVYRSDGASTEIILTQDGAGQYRGKSNELDAGVYAIVARPSRGDELLLPSIAGIEVSAAAEYVHLSSDPQTLIDLATRTNGRVLDFANPDQISLFDRRGLKPTRAYTPMWPTLLLLILIVFLLDLAARRVAWDRWVAQARDETFAVTQAVKTSTDRLRSTKRTIPAGNAIEIEQSRIRKPKIAASVPKRIQTPTQDADDGAGVDDNPLLAAKRRARSQIDDMKDSE